MNSLTLMPVNSDGTYSVSRNRPDPLWCKNELDSFDPNRPQSYNQNPIWATYCPTRSPKFKIHNNRGQAINAFTYKDFIILYALDENDRWMEVTRREQSGIFKRDDKGRVSDPPTIIPIPEG